MSNWKRIAAVAGVSLAAISGATLTGITSAGATALGRVAGYRARDRPGPTGALP